MSMVRAYKLDGGNHIVLVGGNDHDQAYHQVFHHEFRQGGCPLVLARELEALAASIRREARALGATQERPGGR